MCVCAGLRLMGIALVLTGVLVEAGVCVLVEAGVARQHRNFKLTLTTNLTLTITLRTPRSGS